MDGESDATITKVHIGDPLTRPILVNFVDGSIENNSDAHCYLFADQSMQNPRAVVIREKNHFFRGEIKDEVCQTFLLVKRKGESEASLIRVTNCTMYRAVKTQAPKKRPSLDTSTQARASNIHNLSQAFGSKRFKRASSLMMREMEDVSAKEEIIADAISGIEVEANEIDDAFQADSDIIKVLLPPCNRDASDVENIYPIENLLSSSELKSLKAPAKFLMKNPSSQKNERDDYLIRFALRQLGKDPPRIKMQLLLFASALANFINSPIRGKKKKHYLESFCKYSSQIRSKIIREFTCGAGTSRTRPVTKRDRAICYLMIVLLTIFDFKLDMEELSVCIKGCGQKKLLQLVRVVGAIPMFGKASNKTFILKLPLPKLPGVKPKKYKK